MGDCQNEVIYVEGTKMEPEGHKKVYLTDIPPSTFFHELLNLLAAWKPYSPPHHDRPSAFL